MAPVTHIVAVGFKDDVSAETIKETAAGFFKLQQSCVHPTNQQPYILSVKGGKDTSPEGLQNGITHAFVVEFASEEDRDYYVKEDLAHRAYAQGLGSVIGKIVVTDFINASY
ncbi:stress responsive a b barrel domain-containing protein [Plectosphaerella cucumerina]|uniref:Stress responsive a b barrel domain-containing protein n=1 Tax=Plectosphaerella cucumerina TaxID=40658 RepID=A0A8K0X5D6_9PEZI|nr:stress responsive a b barrel domain-containing protein [Plectosphaerella cucumerina]